MNAAYKLKQSPKISEKPILFAKFTVNTRKPVINAYMQLIQTQQERITVNHERN